MHISLNPNITQLSPNGNPFQVIALRMIHHSWNNKETHALIKKENGFQILMLNKINEVTKVYKHPDSDYEHLYGVF